MKDDFFKAAIIQEVQQASPEAKRAQQLAERENLSRYRARRLKEYQEWSDPVKRADRIALAEAEAAAARKLVSEKPKEFAFDFDSHDKKNLGAIIEKPVPVVIRWYDHLLNWLSRTFGLRFK